MKADSPRLTAAGISGLFFVKSVLNRCGGEWEPQSCTTASGISNSQDPHLEAPMVVDGSGFLGCGFEAQSCGI